MKALVGAFSVIVQPVVEPMEHYTALEKTQPVSSKDQDYKTPHRSINILKIEP